MYCDTINKSLETGYGCCYITTYSVPEFLVTKNGIRFNVIDVQTTTAGEVGWVFRLCGYHCESEFLEEFYNQFKDIELDTPVYIHFLARAVNNGPKA